MNCLRCGRQIADTATFCESCEKTVSEPLAESAYLSKQIILPVRRAQPPRLWSRRNWAETLKP